MTAQGHTTTAEDAAGTNARRKKLLRLLWHSDNILWIATMVNLTSVLYDLISANHILHYHSIVDAYGHISVRHPEDPSIFILSGNIAPAIVSQPSDFVHYYVANASSVNPDAPKGYIERYIHSEMYKRFSNVSTVIHAHAEDVLAYANSGVPLKPVFHMPAFLGMWLATQVFKNRADQSR